ncbi:hypothetical protein HY004_02010 [Candidatus Saccharibacteria bacterium]|nr:hypothetical protein [Candidatus Saccharibacteria bacterium]
MHSQYYEPARKLLTMLADLEEDLKKNYKSTDISERALANIAGLQCDLFSTYTLLLSDEVEGPIITKSVILRTILENQGCILHIKDKPDRAKSYLDYTKKIHIQVKNSVENKKTDDNDLKWSDSNIEQRIKLIDTSATRLYDMLSNFTHGNNVVDFLNSKELTDGYIKAIDSYFISLFIGFMSELAIGLNIDDKKRHQIFDVIDEAAKS